MISRKVDRKQENDNYRLLAFYVGAADHEEEKLLFRWHEGCASEEFDLAIREVEAVQDLNTRTTKEKTYHMIVSFRPEDESKLTEEIFKDIERSFAEALGFEEHQRHCGVHKNTANVHMHVAYNMIHPGKFTRHEPYRDYDKRDQVCRELEKKYGLAIDVQEQEVTEAKPVPRAPVRGNDKARTVEAHTGQQSFDSYLKERKQVLLEELGKIKLWRDFHKLCARFGLTFSLRGNGCIFKDKHGKHAAKASSVDRQFSKAAMEKRLGPFETAPEQTFEEKERYTAAPLQKGADRDGLYQEFQQRMEAKKIALAALAEEQKTREAQIRKTWAGHRHRAETMDGLIKKDRMDLLISASQREAAALKKFQGEIKARREEIRKQAPFWNWADFLQGKAREGDEMALAILRSRGEEVRPEGEAEKRPLNPKAEALKKMREFWKEDRRKTRGRYDLTSGDKKGLLASSRMYQIISEDKLLKGTSELDGFTWTVDTKGTVLFKLPSGGLIRDSGSEITYSVSDPVSRAAARRLAKLKFGRDVREAGNMFQRESGARLEF